MENHDNTKIHSFKVLLLTAVSNDISQANVKAVNDARSDPRNRPLLRQSSSMAFQHFSDEVRYRILRTRCS